MTSESKNLKPVPAIEPDVTPIAKPGGFDLNKFKSTRWPVRAMAGGHRRDGMAAIGQRQA